MNARECETEPNSHKMSLSTIEKLDPPLKSHYHKVDSYIKRYSKGRVSKSVF